MATDQKRPDANRKGETLSLRLDGSTKWGLELLARAQMRPISGVIDWLVAEAFRREQIPTSKGQTDTVRNVVADTYGKHELERLLGLWARAPDLMTFDEKTIMSVLSATPFFWRGIPSYHAFRWHAVLDVWGRLRPKLSEIAEAHPGGSVSRADLDKLKFVYDDD